MNKHQVMRMECGLIIFILTAIALSCSTRAGKCDPLLTDKLVVAWQQQDRTSVPIIRSVLEDSLTRNYCFGMDARADAFDLIQSLNLVELTPLLKEVAAMDYRPQHDFRQTWDLVSIGRALNALTQFRDPDAAELNRRRLKSDSWLQVDAIGNLKELECWSATKEVSDLLFAIQLDEESLLVTSKALSFLAKSPESSSDICSRLGAITVTYSECFEPNPASECRDLELSIKTLSAKLDCEAGGKV